MILIINFYKKSLILYFPKSNFDKDAKEYNNNIHFDIKKDLIIINT